MQSVTLYGRLLARAFITGFHNEYQLKAREKPQELHLVTGASGFSKSTRPKSELLRKWTFGDDAFFIARNKVADVIGVADGVGGWRSYGVDPSKFPLSLMSTCERMVKENRFQPHAPASIIADSYYELLEQKQPLVGSSTACIVSLHREERTVYTANLGDSGFLVIRHDEVIHRSQEQQHYFNTPFQLAVAPPPQRGQIISDSPSMAENSSFGVQEGDIILLGTDGLFDNMNEDMLLDYVSKLKDHRQDNIQKTASKIAEEAHQLAFDPDYLSPFALTAIDAGIEIRGGKPDDITVVLARVSSLTESEKEALQV
ncbi:protein phosphatase PTC7 homolog isoform X1 [Octopus sinensis]|uniref:Protein phosphatase n=1 Tax=Octopus sinensis TaxID=2607531 RepID=A0A6P7STM3_9MOLL|nr:protein phosphatase PTC7 homolog isoform X1 [Octopus sinensis]